MTRGNASTFLDALSEKDPRFLNPGQLKLKVNKSFWTAWACLLVVGAISAGEIPRRTNLLSIEAQAVDSGGGAVFVAKVPGDTRVAFQWKFDGRVLPGATNSTLVIAGAQASHEGDYSVLLMSSHGAIESQAARLWVVPPASQFVKANFTNNELRLPYFYLLPESYQPEHRYPLLVWLHGSPGDERTIVLHSNPQPGTHYLAATPGLKVFASLKRQQTDPTILVWPTRRAGDRQWTEDYLNLISALLDKLGSDFNIDSNRIYLAAASEGVHAAWDLAARRPRFFAGAIFLSGWSGRATADSINTLPVWVFHSVTDTNVDFRHSRALVESLRRAGGNPRYTEFQTGTHGSSILAGLISPATVDWLTAQKRHGVGATAPQAGPAQQRF